MATDSYFRFDDYNTIKICVLTSIINTVGELRSGVTGFATIFATGSHRFLLQVRNDEQGWDQSSTDKKGEFDLSLARVRYYFSLKYHRAL